MYFAGSFLLNMLVLYPGLQKDFLQRACCSQVKKFSSDCSFSNRLQKLISLQTEAHDVYVTCLSCLLDGEIARLQAGSLLVLVSGLLTSCFCGAKFQVSFGSSVCGISEKYCWHRNLFLSRSLKFILPLAEVSQNETRSHVFLFVPAQISALLNPPVRTSVPFLQIHARFVVPQYYSCNYWGAFKRYKQKLIFRPLSSSSRCCVQVSLARRWWSPLGLATRGALYFKRSNQSCKNNKEEEI